MSPSTSLLFLLGMTIVAVIAVLVGTGHRYRDRRTRVEIAELRRRVTELENETDDNK